jgi:hypothetical protein
MPGDIAWHFACAGDAAAAMIVEEKRADVETQQGPLEMVEARVRQGRVRVATTRPSGHFD